MHRATWPLQLPNGGAYAYSYSAMGRLTGETDPLGNKTGYKNDLLGRVVEKTLANGAEYTYSYDALGRVTQLTGPEAPPELCLQCGGRPCERN